MKRAHRQNSVTQHSQAEMRRGIGKQEPSASVFDRQACTTWCDPKVNVRGQPEGHGCSNEHKRARREIIPSKITGQESIEENARVSQSDNRISGKKRIEVPSNRQRGKNDRKLSSHPQGLSISIFEG